MRRFASLRPSCARGNPERGNAERGKPSEEAPSEALQAPFPPPGLELGASGWAAEKKWNLPGTYHGLTTVPSQNMIISYDGVQWIPNKLRPSLVSSERDRGISPLVPPIAADDVGGTGMPLPMPASGGGSGLSAPLPYLSTYEVVRSMDHDGDSFTQGLAFGPTGTLFESRGLYGNSAIRVLDSSDGRTLHEVRNTPEIFGEGLAVMGGTTIAQLSWREGTIHEFNATDLSHLRATEQPRDMNEGWGLATDGRDASVLYASDGSNSLFHLATDGSYKVRRTLRAADSRLGTPQRFAGFEGGGALNGLNELEWVPVGGAGEVWANLYPMNEHKLSECIVRLDPATVRHLPHVHCTCNACYAAFTLSLHCICTTSTPPLLHSICRARRWAGSTCAGCWRRSARRCAAARATTCSTASRTTTPPTRSSSRASSGITSIRSGSCHTPRRTPTCARPALGRGTRSPRWTRARAAARARAVPGPPPQPLLSP